MLIADRRVPFVLLLALAGLAGACQSKPAAPAPQPVSADTWAVVDGREIRRDTVEKAYRRTVQTEPPPSDEEALTAEAEPARSGDHARHPGSLEPGS